MYPQSEIEINLRSLAICRSICNPRPNKQSPQLFALHFARFGRTSVCGGRRGDNGERARRPGRTNRHTAKTGKEKDATPAVPPPLAACCSLRVPIVPGNDKNKEEVIPLRGKYLPILSYLSLLPQLSI
ncbi:hypothetical protein ACJJTC_006282 [Scirpophaga incertulas]